MNLNQPLIIDISHKGPFGANQLLCLEDSLALIVGGNGMGKTTIAKEILLDFESRPTSIDRTTTPHTRRALLLHDESTVRQFSLSAGNPMIFHLLAMPILEKQRGRFEQCIASNICKMLTQKAETPGTKFWEMKVSLNNLKVEICGNAAIQLSLGGSCISQLFWAQGERIVVSLAVIAAARQLVSFEAPLIVDSTLGYLDATLVLPCFSFLHRMAQQVIVLESETGGKRLKVESDYLIASDAITGRSFVKQSGQAV